MTIITALKSENRVFIASDGMMSKTTDIIVSNNDKKFRKLANGFYIGVSGLSSSINLIENYFEEIFKDNWEELLPNYSDMFNNNPYKFLTDYFTPKLRKMYEKYDYIYLKNDIKTIDSVHLVVINDNFFVISEDFDVVRINNDYICIGSGSECSTGYLSIGSIKDDNIADKAFNSIEAAIKSVTNCGGHIYCKEIFKN